MEFRPGEEAFYEVCKAFSLTKRRKDPLRFVRRTNRGKPLDWVNGTTMIYDPQFYTGTETSFHGKIFDITTKDSDLTVPFSIKASIVSQPPGSPDRFTGKIKIDGETVLAFENANVYTVAFLGLFMYYPPTEEVYHFYFTGVNFGTRDDDGNPVFATNDLAVFFEMTQVSQTTIGSTPLSIRENLNKTDSSRVLRELSSKSKRVIQNENLADYVLEIKNTGKLAY